MNTRLFFLIFVLLHIAYSQVEELINQKNELGLTPVNYAVVTIEEDVETAKYIVAFSKNKKTDASIRDNKGYTPFMNAIVMNKPITAGCLLLLYDIRLMDDVVYAMEHHDKKFLQSSLMKTEYYMTYDGVKDKLTKKCTSYLVEELVITRERSEL
jgi:hypothetical protein